jgi:hypothetical protein
MSTAAVWGTTVLAQRTLRPGQSLRLGEGADALSVKPDASAAPDYPVRAVGSGWEIDLQAVRGGVVYLRGRPEDALRLAQHTAVVPVIPGDFGLLQYGQFSLFFQFTAPAPPLKSKPRVDWLLLFGFLFSLASIGGGMLLLFLLFSGVRPDPNVPFELQSQQDLAVRFNLEEEPPAPPTGGDASQGIKDPGAKDKKDMGGGRKAKGDEGKLGKKGDADKTEIKGDINKGLGAMSDVLQSEVGQEIQETLGTISSVAEALGGLNSESISFGQGSGLGFRGTGSGGGGEDGVPFGSGTLDTGWGPGKGGGYGRGSGGPGGQGRGGFGMGGNGKGDGTGGGGEGEHQVKGGDGAGSGQGLTPAQIQRVVMSRRGAFQACYETAVAREPNLKGGVTVSWTVLPNGGVSGARIASSSLANARVEGCILRQFSRLQFPTADKNTNATWPFVFKPGAN